jgi:hypothetical protein
MSKSTQGGDSKRKGDSHLCVGKAVVTREQRAVITCYLFLSVLCYLLSSICYLYKDHFCMSKTVFKLWSIRAAKGLGSARTHSGVGVSVTKFAKNGVWPLKKQRHQTLAGLRPVSV